MTDLTVDEWHAQFVRQAQWTQATRNHLYRRARLMQAGRVLDVGCGTGAITSELAGRTRGEVIGLDRDPAMIAFARATDARARYEQGDALSLPYPDAHFDVVTCHFVLLWIGDPGQAVREMARVTSGQGSVLICAEPDYGGRIDWPELPIREWQIEGLRMQGADPLIGRQLRRLLTEAGLHAEVGIHPSHWNVDALRAHFEEEWTLLWHDVGESVADEAFADARSRARQAIERGTRLVHVPIFHAMAVGRRVDRLTGRAR